MLELPHDLAFCIEQGNVRTYSHNLQDYFLSDSISAFNILDYIKRLPELFEAIQEVVLNTFFGTGRESFVMLFGDFKQTKYIPLLINLLRDEAVAGQAILALRQLGATQAKEQVRPFLHHSKTNGSRLGRF